MNARPPIAISRPKAAPDQDVLVTALRLLALGPVFQVGKRNGLSPSIAAELRKKHLISATTLRRREFGVNLAVAAWCLTTSGWTTLAAAQAPTGSPNTGRANDPAPVDQAAGGAAQGAQGRPTASPDAADIDALKAEIAAVRGQIETLRRANDASAGTSTTPPGGTGRPKTEGTK